MIKVNNISFGYKRKKILSGVSLTVEGGELCSVIGVNGSGKTTLLRILARALAPIDGSVEVCGKGASEYTQKDYAKLISYLPQQRYVPSATVYDYVSAGRYPYLGFSGRLTAKDEKAIENAVGLTGIGELLDKRLTELSGGELQRVYFAQLLTQGTPFILLDEPATHLDVSNLADTEELILSLRQSGRGIVSVSHDLSSALRLSDKLLVLDGGSAAFYGTPSEALSSGVIERVFGVRVFEQTIDGEIEYFFKKDHGNGR